MTETKFNPKDHILNMKGKDYLEVKWRLVWFKEENSKGSITTEILNTSPVLAKATILIDGVIVATGHGSATPKGTAVWSGREIEKAETAAIGRALAHAGYGTQFTDEDETDNIVDSPVEKVVPNEAARLAKGLKTFADLKLRAAKVNVTLTDPAADITADQLLEHYKTQAAFVKAAEAQAGK
jgi:hypothetical protein